MARKVSVKPINKRVGEALKQVRLERGMKQIDVAYVLDKSEDVYSRYERGETSLRYDQTERFALALRMTADDLRALIDLALKGASAEEIRRFVRDCEQLTRDLAGESQEVQATARRWYADSVRHIRENESNTRN